MYSTGSVSAPVLPAEVVGGLIGQIKDDTGAVATAAYWDTETSGQAASAGGAVGKTTAEMKTIATFAGWNIATPAEYTDEVWYIVEGGDYPRLAWEGVPSVAPPVAAFSASPTTGTAPLTVQFTDASTNAPTAWSWNFGDGGTSDQQHPSHTYNEPGTYTVALTVSNAYGEDSETKIGLVAAYDPLVPDFTATPQTGYIPLT
ncbi:MAG TPA: PKD domain-containing protein, partial [Corynebacterium sp.]|nr:PKD domain-containing protein [Corynebacterium sp.]